MGVTRKYYIHTPVKLSQINFVRFKITKLRQKATEEDIQGQLLACM